MATTATTETSGLITTPTTTTRTAKKELGKDDFLMLLTKQMQYQDPLNPTDNTAYISQMSNFSTLEQMTNMNKNLQSFLNKSNDSYKVEALSLLGSQATAKTADSPDTLTGIIESVKFTDGVAIFRMAGKDIKMGDITSVGIPNLSQA